MVKEIKHVDSDCTCEGIRCANCIAIKCVEHFKKKRGNPEILNKRCRSCYDSNQRWHDKHPEVIQRIHEKLKPRKVENAKKWNQAHPEEMRQHRKEWRKTHPDKRWEGIKEWRKTHPDKVRHYARVRAAQRRVIVKNFSEKYSLIEWENLKKQFDHTCICCGKQEPEIRLTVDHVVPLSRGGTNSINNIQPLCGYCNCRKGTKTIDYRPSSV